MVMKGYPLNWIKRSLKAKSGVGIIVDHSIDYTVVNSSVFSIFRSFDLRNYIFQSAKKCEMPSFCMT